MKSGRQVGIMVFEGVAGGSTPTASPGARPRPDRRDTRGRLAYELAMRRHRKLTAVLISALALGVGCSEAGGRPSRPRATAEAGAGGDDGSPVDTPCLEEQPDPEQLACRLLPPTTAECREQPDDGWAGCYAGGCAVCRELVEDFPFYFDWHPCCRPNITCGFSSPQLCNARCPQPSERDRELPCFVKGTRAR
jgi:hypothetical protein